MLCNDEIEKNEIIYNKVSSIYTCQQKGSSTNQVDDSLTSYISISIQEKILSNLSL